MLRACLKNHRSFAETAEHVAIKDVTDAIISDDEAEAGQQQGEEEEDDGNIEAVVAMPAEPDADAHMSILAGPAAAAMPNDASPTAADDGSLPGRNGKVDLDQLALYRGQARRLVATHVRLVPTDGDVSEDCIAKVMLFV